MIILLKIIVTIHLKNLNRKLRKFKNKNIGKIFLNVVIKVNHIMPMECVRIAITRKEELREPLHVPTMTGFCMPKDYARIATYPYTTKTKDQLRSVQMRIAMNL
jgi:hypothetical protein